MAQEISAKLSNFAESAQKTRLVIDLVRGKKVVDALNILSLTPKKAAHPVRKLIYSAMSNAEENFGVAAMTSWFTRSTLTKLPPASGAGLARVVVSSRWLKRRAHVTVVLREIE